MRRNLILPLVLVIGILIFSSVASASLWDILGLTKISGSLVASDTSRVREPNIVLDITNPKAGDAFLPTDTIKFRTILLSKANYKDKTMKYNLYAGDRKIKSGNVICAMNSKCPLELEIPVSQLIQEEQKLVLEVCGLTKNQMLINKEDSKCVDYVKAGVTIGIGTPKESTETSTDNVDENAGIYKITLGKSIKVFGVKIIFLQLSSDENDARNKVATLKISKA